MKLKIESDVYLSVVMDVFWQKGTYKNHPEQNLPDKKPGQNLPVKNPRELRKTTIKTHVCMHVLLKIGRGIRDVWRTLGGSEMCDKVW